MKKVRKPGERAKEQPVTYEMYAAIPDDGKRYEIIDGVMEMMSPGPSSTHQTISGEMAFILKQSCNDEFLILGAPLDVILSETDVLQPDILMVHRSRITIVTKRGNEGAPDLVMEILSPGSRKRDKIDKLRTYAKYGIPEYWVVDSDARVLEQYGLVAPELYGLQQLFEENETVSSDRAPCVSFVVRELFKDIPN